jgi:hypothetical protein
VFQVLQCSDYSHLLHLDAVTTAIELVSSNIMILNMLRLTMAHASSIQNNLDPITKMIIATLFATWRVFIIYITTLHVSAI